MLYLEVDILDRSAVVVTGRIDLVTNSYVG